MCRFYEESRRIGFEIGERQGRRIGLKIGERQGRVMNSYKAVNCVIEGYGVSLEEALKILKISKAEYLEGKRLTEEEN